MGMTKKELIEKIAAQADIPKAKAGKALAAIVGTIAECVRQGDEISIAGFGKFFTSERQARKVRNFRTGEMMEIPTRKVARFKPSKAIRQAAG